MKKIFSLKFAKLSRIELALSFIFSLLCAYFLTAPLINIGFLGKEFHLKKISEFVKREQGINSLLSCSQENYDAERISECDLITLRPIQEGVKLIHSIVPGYRMTMAFEDVFSKPENIIPGTPEAEEFYAALEYTAIEYERKIPEDIEIQGTSYNFKKAIRTGNIKVINMSTQKEIRNLNLCCCKENFAAISCQIYAEKGVSIFKFFEHE